MRRRDVLKAAAACPLLSAWALSSGARAAAAAAETAGGARSLRHAAARRRRVRPSDPDWPSAAGWQSLAGAVGGRLLAVPALCGPCVERADGPACRDVISQIGNPFYIGDQPGGTQVSGWLDAWTPAPSAYAVKAAGTADVVAAVNFARERNLRLAVKGTGHSYQGTSSAPDSLLVWTRAMNKVTLHEAFVPRGCDSKADPVPAVTAEAGAMWIDLYHAVTSVAGRYVQGGGCASVGVAGLVQSGGFGSFSKGFGTAAAGLLEAEVVTADGRARTVNACSDTDLFWALKGGGGGSWGVVTRLTLRTHELPEFFGAAWGEIKAHSDEAFGRLLTRFFELYAVSLFNPHWGEQVAVGGDNTLKLSMVSQGVDKAQAHAVWAPFFDWVTASPRDFTITAELGSGARAARGWWDPGGKDRMIQDPRTGAPAHHAWWTGDQEQVGAFFHGYDSLWLPATLLHRQARQRLVEALFAGSRHKGIELHFNKGLAGAPRHAITATLDTATNPAVTGAFALAIVAGGEGPAYPGLPRPAIDLDAARADARAIDRATAALRHIAPEAGSYVSESNYFNTSWQRAFWGAHYPRLRAIKRKYDPDALFIVHHGVGSEDWSADGFMRLVPVPEGRL